MVQMVFLKLTPDPQSKGSPCGNLQACARDSAGVEHSWVCSALDAVLLNSLIVFKCF